MQEIYDKDTWLGDGLSLGIELGSTRIKAVLMQVDTGNVLASESYAWENKMEDGFWSYSIEDIWIGIRESYKKLKMSVQNSYGITLKKVAALGFSGMMHGYMVFDKEDNLLVPFRTWRNNRQVNASEDLSALFKYPIPQRWSIAHLYQSILNGENHVSSIDYMTTLSGYVHWKLTGQRVLGIGDASGMFPIDIETKDYNQRMINRFNKTIESNKYQWKIEEILPTVLVAGENAGCLSKEGALLIDPTGELEAGIIMCPPEGDAGTGMIATNSIAKKTGNVSAGTSVFAMVVLEKELDSVHEEIDQVTTPDGSLVAMVHSNNCTSNLDGWMQIFDEVISTVGAQVDTDTLYGRLYNKALEGDSDCGGLLSIGYLSGEHITGFEEGRPLFVRTPNAQFNLANFMRVNLYTALGALKIGIDILKQENVSIDKIYGHGGFFKIDGVGNRFMAAALDAPIYLMETAGEGGAWGIAILAAYVTKNNHSMSLSEFLEKKIFQNHSSMQFIPNKSDVDGFNSFMKIYKEGLHIEKAALQYLH